MSADQEALAGDFVRWLETFARLHRHTRYRAEAQFVLGAIYGCLETLEAIGRANLQETLLAAAREATQPDEVDLALSAIARWLGR